MLLYTEIFCNYELLKGDNINLLPIELEITNFTSYKHEIIHFNEFGSPVIITGDNGNGKSSIIDMITTALYFRARCTDSRGSGIDDLIYKH